MAELQKVTKGDKTIPGATWNEMVDLLTSLKERVLGNRVPTNDAVKSTGFIKAINSGDDNFELFEIVGLDEAAFDPGATLQEFTRNPPAFRVSSPGCDHVGKFAVLQAPLKSGEGNSAEALISGVTVCQVWITDTAHGFADIDPDSREHLLSAEKGSAQILWKTTGGPDTGLKYAIVRLSNAPEGTTCTSRSTSTTTMTTEEGTTEEGTTGEGTTGTGTTGTGTTGTGTTGTGTTEETTGEGTTGTTGEGTTTTTAECPAFECGGECEVSLEVVTDVQCVDGDIVVTKTTICLPSSQVSL